MLAISLKTQYGCNRKLLVNTTNLRTNKVPIAANCRYIVTYNKKDFASIEGFGLKAIDAAEFLEILRKDDDYGDTKR